MHTFLYVGGCHSWQRFSVDRNHLAAGINSRKKNAIEGKVEKLLSSIPKVQSVRSYENFLITEFWVLR